MYRQMDMSLDQFGGYGVYGRPRPGSFLLPFFLFSLLTPRPPFYPYYYPPYPYPPYPYYPY